MRGCNREDAPIPGDPARNGGCAEEAAREGNGGTEAKRGGGKGCGSDVELFLEEQIALLEDEEEEEMEMRKQQEAEAMKALIKQSETPKVPPNKKSGKVSTPAASKGGRTAVAKPKMPSVPARSSQPKSKQQQPTGKAVPTNLKSASVAEEILQNERPVEKDVQNHDDPGSKGDRSIELTGLGDAEGSNTPGPATGSTIYSQASTTIGAGASPASFSVLPGHSSPVQKGKSAMTEDERSQLAKSVAEPVDENEEHEPEHHNVLLEPEATMICTDDTQNESEHQVEAGHRTQLESKASAETSLSTLGVNHGVSEDGSDTKELLTVDLMEHSESLDSDPTDGLSELEHDATLAEDDGVQVTRIKTSTPSHSEQHRKGPASNATGPATATGKGAGLPPKPPTGQSRAPNSAQQPGVRVPTTATTGNSASRLVGQPGSRNATAGSGNRTSPSPPKRIGSSRVSQSPPLKPVTPAGSRGKEVPGRRTPSPL
eukprot:417718-Rhodomonas_salina.1